MKKVLLFVLCLTASTVMSMTYDKKAGRNRRYSTIYQTPLDSAGYGLEYEDDLDKQIQLLEERRKALFAEKKLVNFMLGLSTDLAPQAKKELEKNASELDHYSESASENKRAALEKSIRDNLALWDYRRKLNANRIAELNAAQEKLRAQSNGINYLAGLQLQQSSD